MKMEREQFISEVAQKMRDGMCELFVGSGISAQSKMPTWSSFLGPYAQDLGITVDDNDDLPLIAQYIVNNNSGNRNTLCQAVFETFERRAECKYIPNLCHRAILDFPVHTIWTTNYDCLLERAFIDRDTRVISSEDDFLHPHVRSEIEIIKIHGCAKRAAQEIVLTRADYDSFLENKPKISQRLREAFINSNLLFVGYSYHDPNIHELLVQATKMMHEMTNQHYLLLATKPQTTEGRKIRFEQWIKELNRIGIQVLVVDQDCVADILDSIGRKARQKAVFVTGSHDPQDDMLINSAKEIGRILAESEETVLINGQSSGIGNEVLSAFMQTVFCRKEDINHRAKIFPNPYAISPSYANDSTLLPMLKKARTPLMTQASHVIAFPGGMGTKAEIEIAIEKGRLVFPIVLIEEHYQSIAIQCAITSNENMIKLNKVSHEYCDALKEKRLLKQERVIQIIEEIINENE